MEEKLGLREEAFNKPLDGHSFILTDQCGTGKTYLIIKVLHTTDILLTTTY